MSKPTVMVLQADGTIGLTVARALGREGVPVIGVGFQEDGFGLRSRYLVDRHVIQATPREKMVQQLLDLVRTVRPDFLMGVSEWVLTALNERRDEFSPYTRFLFPGQEVLNRAFNKAQTLSIAAALGVPIPQSYTVNSPADVARIAAICSYPLVLKPQRQYIGENFGHLNF